MFFLQKHTQNKNEIFSSDVQSCQNGSIVLVQGGNSFDERVVGVGEDCVTLNGVIVKCSDGNVILLRDAWSSDVPGYMLVYLFKINTMCHSHFNFNCNMSFLPAIEITALRSHAILGYGALALNVYGNMFARSFFSGIVLTSLNKAGGCTSQRVVATEPYMSNPAGICFVLRHGVETLLLVNSYHIVEMTTGGIVMRSIPLPNVGKLFNETLTYSESADLIAVTSQTCGTVLLRYECGSIMQSVLLPGKVSSRIAFSPDGKDLFLVSMKNILKFNLSTENVSTELTAINLLCDIIACEDGRVFVSSSKNIVNLTTQEEVGVFVNASRTPPFIAYSSLLQGLLVLLSGRGVFLFPDAWPASSRCAWLSACV